MRCVSCDKALSDYECSRKTLHGDYLDMCNRCYGSIKGLVPTTTNWSLEHPEDTDEVEDGEVELDKTDLSCYTNSFTEEEDGDGRGN